MLMIAFSPRLAMNKVHEQIDDGVCLQTASCVKTDLHSSSLLLALLSHSLMLSCFSPKRLGYTTTQGHPPFYQSCTTLPGPLTTLTARKIKTVECEDLLSVTWSLKTCSVWNRLNCHSACLHLIPGLCSGSLNYSQQDKNGMKLE